MAQQTGERMDGLFGLAGLGSCESFTDLEALASEAGVPNAPAITRNLRKKHSCACKRLRDALPVAVDVKNLLESAVGNEATPVRTQLAVLQGLRGLGASALAKAQKAATKTAKKIAKVQAKEAKQEAKIAAKVAKYTAAGKTAKANKVIAKDAKQDAKVAAKLVKLDSKLQAAQTAVSTLSTPAAVTTPTQTAAAVLASQAQVQAATPAAQQLMQEVVANAANPGSTVPTQSLNTSQEQFAIPYASSGGQSYAPTEAAPVESGGFFDSIPPVALIGGGVALLFLVPKLMGSKRS